MKNLCCSVIVLLFGLSAFAQTTDTVRKDTSKPFSVNATAANKPEYIVDGVIYKGDLNTLPLNPNDISSITVLKSPAQTLSYGAAGANGVIVIKTKAYENGYGKLLTDTISHSSLPDSAMYVVDGVMSDKKLEGIDPNDILSITVLKENKGASPTEGSSGRATVIIITKPGAAKSYKKRFAEFSPPYKEYLDSHNDDDSGLTYSIDGYNCDNGMDGITRLYKLQKEKIAKIKISTKENLTKVDITTKK